MSYILSQSKNLAYIYLLIDPRSNQPFYVGRTISPHSRLQTHVESAKKYKVIDDGTKRAIINSIIGDGFYPVMRVIEVTITKYQEEREYTWWLGFVERGYRISNEVRKPYRFDHPRQESEPLVIDPYKSALIDLKQKLDAIESRQARTLVVHALIAFTTNKSTIESLTRMGELYINDGKTP